MILLTVGMQLPFDRLIRTVDEIAGSLPPAFAQTGLGSYIPVNMEHRRTISAGEFEDRLTRSSLVVSHAGIGTILSAQEHRKPVILFPRRDMLGEHRNDHQISTCKRLEGRPGIYVAWTEQQLYDLLSGPSLGFADDDAIEANRKGLVNNLRAYFARHGLYSKRAGSIASKAG